MAKQRVLLTGGAQGIGAGIAEKLLQERYEVTVLDRVRPANENVRYFEVDLSDRTQTAEVLRAAVAEGPITRLVNNVGIVRGASLEDTTLDDFDAVIDLNVRSAIQCAQALLPGMREERFGRIVTISSRAAVGKTLRTSYTVSKAGLNGLTRSWALELGKDGITANAIGPGAMDTDLFWKENARGPIADGIINAIPVGRIGQPSDIAAAVSFFCSADAGFVTGQILYVCGGSTVGKAMPL